MKHIVGFLERREQEASRQKGVGGMSEQQSPKAEGAA